MKLRPAWILGGAWIVMILYAYPGYLNFDAGEQLFQARTGNFDDWFPPLMAAYWKVLDLIVRGPLLMLAIQTALFVWGVHAILGRRFAPTTAAWLAAALVLFPPILTPMAPVWKDAQMAGFLVAGVALALRPGRRARIAGVVLLFLAAGVRDNAAAALPPLALAIAGAWGVRRRVLVAAALVIGLFAAATGVNAALTRRAAHPWARTVEVIDLAGVICRADDLSDAEIDRLLDGTGHVAAPEGARTRLCGLYTPRVWFPLVNADAHYFVDAPDDDQRAARARAWRSLVIAHPVAYLEHRAAVMAQVLGFTDEPTWEPVCQTIGANPHHLERVHHDASLSWWQAALGRAFRALGDTIVFRPWAYAVLALIALIATVRRRDHLLAALVGSGLLYEAGYFVFAATPDFRYSHWLVTCTCIALVTIVGERIRAAAVVYPPT